MRVATDIHRPQVGYAAVRESTRLDFLDGLRGFAALVVFLSHAIGRVSPAFHDFTYSRFDMGSFGVTVFFLCSGFIIPVSLERQGSLRSFWLRRVFRLYPLYWFSMALFLLCYLAGLNPLPHDFEAQPAHAALANLTMFQTFLGFSDIDRIYWTLTFEMLFYVIVSVLFVAGLSKRTVPLTVGVSLAAILVEVILPRTNGLHVPIGMISFLAIMFMGTVFYRVHSAELRGAVAIAVGLLVLVTLIVTPLSNPADNGGMWQYLYVMTAWLGGYIVFGAVFLARARPIPSLMLYLGRISYSLYLMHQIVLVVIPQLDNPALAVVVWLVVLLLVASATYRWIEQPAIALGHRLTQGPRR